MEQLQNFDLSPTSAFGAALLRFILAGFWIAHWWFKVGYRSIPATEVFFKEQGLPTWLAWFDIRFEVVNAAGLILGRVHVDLSEERILFFRRRHRASDLVGLRTGCPGLSWRWRFSLPASGIAATPIAIRDPALTQVLIKTDLLIKSVSEDLSESERLAGRCCEPGG